MISFWMRRLLLEEVEEGDRGDDGEDGGCFSGGEDVA